MIYGYVDIGINIANGNAGEVLNSGMNLIGGSGVAVFKGVYEIMDNNYTYKTISNNFAKEKLYYWNLYKTTGNENFLNKCIRYEQLQHKAQSRIK